MLEHSEQDCTAVVSNTRSQAACVPRCLLENFT